MKYLNSSSCPLCGSPANFKAYGVVAPWITELLETDSLYSRYFVCKKCTLGFFSYRFTDNEAQKIYSTYRTGKFYSVRHSWEPWYGSAENNAYLPKVNQRNIESRVNLMDTTLKLAGINQTFKGCVDFGGDLGQFFPPNVIGTKYLIDLSAKPEIKEDFTIINNVSEIPDSVDLVMSCGVLEHLSILENIISQLSSALHEHGVLYLEVPLDGFKMSKFHASNTYKKYLEMITRKKPFFILMDFLTGITRQFFGRIPWFGIVKQSEHINYFNKISLETLCSKFDGKIWISNPDFSHKQGKFRLGRIAAVLSR
jgi:SAM-dependent methyltransferase